MKIMISLAILLSMLGTTMYGGVPYGGPADELAPVFSPRAGAPCRIVGSAELRTVKGGLSIPRSSGGGKGGGSGGSSSSKLVNISLTNVPYVNQIIPNYPRSEYYCGLASALMVRTKGEYGKAAPRLSNPDKEMKQMDKNLLQGTHYGYNDNASEWTGCPSIDIEANKGLLYIGYYDSEEIQYKKTIRVINHLYTARGDGVRNDGRVTGIDASVATASQSVDSIWNHIKTNKQPAVVVVDSNILEYMAIHDIPPTYRATPTLHYIVINGIREKTVGGIRYFSIYDPGTPGIVEYTETQLRGLIQMPDHYSLGWVYRYPRYRLNISSPSYRLLVKGN